MIGRSQELAAALRLLGEVSTSGRALVVTGEAGIGKTTLVCAVEDHARQDGFRELRCTGLQSETIGGFAGLHELLHPVLDLVPALPARQRAALSTAFGLVEGPAPDRLLISLAVLGLLEEVASRQRLLVVVEDLQWLDPSTVEVITFLVRRLTNAPILLLVSQRAGSATGVADDLLRAVPITRIDLPPLSVAESAELLDALPQQLDVQARRRVLAEAAGNPLALGELAAAVTAHGLGGAAGLAGRLPTTRRLEEAFLDTAAALNPAGRRMLLLAAAAHGGSVTELLVAGRRLGTGPEDLDSAERTGLLAVRGGDVVFRHPLVRSAIYGAASVGERTAAHQVLGEVTTDASRAAWHRAAATYERDESVAAQLEGAAEYAARRGAQPEAAAALRRAAALSPDGREEVRRLAAAAEIARQAGATAVAEQLLKEALPLDGDAGVTVQLAMTRLLLSHTAGTPGPSSVDLIAVSRRLAGPSGQEHPEERIVVLWGAAIDCNGRALSEAERRAVETELTAIDPGGWHPAQQVALALLDPVRRSAELRPQLGRLAAELADDLLGLHILALAAESVQHLPMALQCWSAVARRARSTGFPNDEAQALRGRANIGLMTGRLTAAMDDAGNALRMIETMGLPVSTAATAAAAVRAMTWRGDFTGAKAAVTRSRELSASPSDALVSADQAWAAGLVALTEQRYRDAWTELSRTSAHPTIALWAVGDLTEAAVRSGKSDSVTPVVTAAEQSAAAFAAPHPNMLVHRSWALLSDGPDAGEHFRSAVAAGRTAGTPLELARTQLLYGEWLRRRRQSLPAREQLSEALHTFDVAGAHPWAERAAAELRATGVVPVRSGGAPGADMTHLLTPQELQIARLAGRGLSNKEIADRVYLSHRTVGAHLYKAFPKLGIASRGQLRDVLPAAKDDS